ncbi:hypothetical protein L208DRAFT_186099 [Tricholoma matsutake]|nr:hypothetical protein L208DRAFT_186099 [Tricholoma matsutake 945]
MESSVFIFFLPTVASETQLFPTLSSQVHCSDQIPTRRKHHSVVKMPIFGRFCRPVSYKNASMQPCLPRIVPASLCYCTTPMFFLHLSLICCLFQALAIKSPPLI